MSGHEWAVLGIYLVGSIIVGCVFGLLIRAARALMDWRSSRDIPRFSINDWLQVTSGDEEFRHQVMDAIYAQNDLMVDTPVADLVWVMSQEWKDEIGKLAGSHVSALNYAQYKHTVLAFIDATLLGIPIEVREGAGFPKLIKRGGDE